MDHYVRVDLATLTLQTNTFYTRDIIRRNDLLIYTRPIIREIKNVNYIIIQKLTILLLNILYNTITKYLYTFTIRVKCQRQLKRYNVQIIHTLHILIPVSYTHLRAHETPEHLVCRLLLEKKKPPPPPPLPPPPP